MCVCVRVSVCLRSIEVGSDHENTAVALGRRRTIPSMMRTSGISSAALAAFDLPPDDEQSFQTMIDCNRVALTASTEGGDNSACQFF